MVTQISAISYPQTVGDFAEGSLATYLENHLAGELYDVNTFLQDIVGAMCETAVGGALLGGPVKQCVAVLETLMIEVPLARFAFVVLGTMLCDEISNGLLDGVPG
jgi:hypothetical protein